MAIDPQRLLHRHFPPVEQAYKQRDTILYALGVGLGADPTDTDQLEFVYESQLRALPSMAVVLGTPGFWAKQPDTGIDWRRILHVEQSFELHLPLEPQGEIIGRNRVTAVYDKGPDKGALLCQERQIIDAISAATVATVRQVSLLRGDGGFGSTSGSVTPPHLIPSRAADAQCDLTTLPQSALIYRLSGDLNPLHADPAVARAAGFPRPILHGLCSMGVACHAVLRALLGYESRAIRAMRVRFTAPIFPGETLRTSFWVDGNVVSFRSRVPERDVVALDSGRIDIDETQHELRATR